MSIDVKCAITTAILSVLVYLLLINIFARADPKVGKEINETEWYKSMEVIMLISVFLAYNINNFLFNSCRA